jgi:hypothetical protein
MASIMHASYPNLRALTQFHKLETIACAIAIDDQCEIVGFLVPSEPLLTRVGVLCC